VIDWPTLGLPPFAARLALDTSTKMTHRRYPRLWLATLVVLLPAGVAGRAAERKQAPRPVEFNRDIHPILSNTCFVCHGPDNNRRKAKLRLDREADAFADRGGYRAIVPGKAAQSEVYKRLVSTDPKERMPPAKLKKDLTKEQIELIRQWIDQGARYEAHWSLMPARRPALPAVKDGSWPRNPIDRFLLARLEKEGLPPSAEADRHTLIRRLSLDLRGLPPTLAEVDAFLRDQSPQAYEQLVDRLLESPHHGERMAVYWLDVVRYADTGGYHSDNHRDLWLYRDYVIKAFNDNLPFDRFVTEQLAGDLLPNATREQRIASGFNRLLQTTEEGGAQPREYTAKYLADRVRNTGTIFLGLTLGCCECHNHKFDPFTTKEFYQFGAFFADVQEAAVGRQAQTPMPTAIQEAQLKILEGRIAELGKKRPMPASEIAALKRQQTEIRKAAPTTLVSTSGPPRVVRVLPRGNWLSDAGEIVQPGVPGGLPPLDVKGRRATRLDLARWVVAPENPLTARVFVNRLWQLFFGQGLVKTADDFGAQGAWPSHPELLDWLAVEFRASGWDVRHMIKLMVTSAAYRQTSKASPELHHRDPYNILLARQGRFRLDAEFVRDNALAISGLLTREVGGPSVKPYQPAGYWRFLNFPVRHWTADKGPEQYRRGLYTYWQRTFLHPSLLAFDASTREECVVARPRSNIPQQALVLLNDPTYVEASRALAVRLLREVTGDASARIQHAFRLALVRPATADEIKVLTGLYERHLHEYQADPKASQAILHVGLRPPPADLPAPELAAWSSVARVVLNLHETITRE
jgi:mono/diheme cytochrome c family protein